MTEIDINYHKVSTGKCKKRLDKLRRIKISEHIQAAYDVESKEIGSYLFNEEKYTLKDAKEWVKNHSDSTIHAALVDIDYVICKQSESWAAIKEEAMELALEEAANLMRE